MKKIIAMVMAVAMMLSLAAICSFAAVDGYTVDGVVAVPENGKTTLSISVSVPEGANLAGVMVDVTYNTDKLTLDSVDTSVADGVLAGWAKDTLSKDDGVYRIQAFTAAPKSDNVLNASAKLATISFNLAARNDIELEDGDVKLTVSDASNLDAESVDANFSTSVKILTVDKSGLEAAIAQAKALKESEYTEDSFKAVSSALSAAEEVFAATGVSQSAIDKAVSDLNAAIEALVKFASKEDKDALTETVKDAGALNKNDYTADSYKTVQDAIDAANEVLNKDGVTEAEIAAAKKAVADAVAALVKVSGGNTDTNKPADTNTGDTNVEETPNTSDFNLVIYVSVIVVALAAVAFVIVKKKRA